MEYFEINITSSETSETINDIICALAGEAGCESFVPQENGVTAYAQKTFFDENLLSDSLNFFPIEGVQVTYTVKDAENKDWNEEWEQNSFQPIIIGNECVVHGTSHTDVPEAKYDIVINPRLAFGSGHHQTTGMIMKELLNMDMKGKTVLDMGCGTCILGILAMMRGADNLTAIDIDSWSVDNSRENLLLNHIENATVMLGDANLLNNSNLQFDVVLANINRNILLADMEHYVNSLNANGMLLMSGFYQEDVPLIREKAENLGLTYLTEVVEDNWTCIKFKK